MANIMYDVNRYGTSRGDAQRPVNISMHVGAAREKPDGVLIGIGGERRQKYVPSRGVWVCLSVRPSTTTRT